MGEEVEETNLDGWIATTVKDLAGLDANNGSHGLRSAVELQKLILAHNSIASLKEDLRNLPFLAVLNLSHNSLSQLPAAIGE